MSFVTLASQLLNERIILIAGVEHRILEIEFYYYSDDHPDLYVHRSNDQKQYAVFGFHKGSNKPDAKYRGGTFKGLDICLGTSDYHFGILIRTIQNLENQVIIEGPCRVVNYILDAYSKPSIEDFVPLGKLLNILANEHNFVIQSKSLDSKDIFVGPRVGLSDKYPEFQKLPYRFATSGPKKEKKFLKLFLL